MTAGSESADHRLPVSLTDSLAAHCMRPISAAALARAAMHLADWVGCAAIGAVQPEARALYTGFIAPFRYTPAAEGHIPGDPWQLLMYQSALGNMLEMDDLYKQGLVHPGPVVIPAALFVARQLGASGRALLEAIVRGYEAMNCLGRSVGSGHYRYWHNTATCGPTGAAAATCSLLQLDRAQWVHAFGHAITQSAGLWQVRLEPGQSKQWHNARAAQTGVQAAMLARAGTLAPLQILEGEKGFYAAMCPDAAPESLVCSGSGQGGAPAPEEEGADEWQILRTSLKPWAACRHSHATIDCALALHEQLALRPSDTSCIEAVVVRSYADALAFCDQAVPRTPIQARFSLQHAAAVTLLEGAPSLKAFDVAGLRDPAVDALRRKIRVELHPALEAEYPAHFGAEIELRLTDGTVLHCLRRDAWGDPELPMDAAAIRQKANSLLKSATGTDEGEALIAFAMSLHADGADSQGLQEWVAQLDALLVRLSTE